MQGTDPFLPPAASGGDSENAAPAGQERRAAPSRRRPPGRDPEAGEPRPRPDRAPPAAAGGPASPSHPRPRPRNPGGRCPSCFQPQMHAKGAPPGGAVSLLAWQLSPRPRVWRSDHHLTLPRPGFHVFFALRRSPASEEGAQERVGVRFLQRQPLAGCPESTSPPPALALTL